MRWALRASLANKQNLVVGKYFLSLIASFHPSTYLSPIFFLPFSLIVVEY